MSKFKSYKKLEELAFSDLFVDPTDQTYSELRKAIANTFESVRRIKGNIRLSLYDRKSVLPIKKHEDMTWLHR